MYKILNRLSFLQNLINMKSRINMANRIICGLNAYNELIKTGEGSFNEDGIYNIYRMDVIYSDLISTNKFIVARFGNNIESGLNLILSESTNSFYIFKTHCWENNISWFEI